MRTTIEETRTPVELLLVPLRDGMRWRATARGAGVDGELVVSRDGIDRCDVAREALIGWFAAREGRPVPHVDAGPSLDPWGLPRAREGASVPRQGLLRGDRVEAGETPEGYARGALLTIKGRTAIVFWDSGYTTELPVDFLRREGERPVPAAGCSGCDDPACSSCFLGAVVDAYPAR